MNGVVIIVDDDASVRTSTERLLRSAGVAARSYETCEAFLAAPRPTSPACLLLDVRMPGRDGFALQEELIRAGVELPIVFVTGHADVRAAVRAMRGGAVEFLLKPVDPDQLLETVRGALERSDALTQRSSVRDELRVRYESLTARERDVMALVAAGLLNKQVAGELGIAEKTVKIHRARVMQKMGAGSLADLVRSADALGVHPPRADSVAGA